jgi:hypothetical protein
MANAAPLAPTPVSPDNNSYVLATEEVTFAWKFNDPGDLQGRADLRYRIGTGAWTVLNDLSENAETTFTFGGGTFFFNTTYEWQVFCFDSGGLGSGWSASWFFNTIASIPAPVVTIPSGTTVTTTPVLVSWSVPDPFTQDAYLILVSHSPSNANYYFGEVVESVAARSVLVPVPVLPAGSDPASYMEVRYRFNGHWNTTTGRVVFSNVVLPPERPLVVLAQVEDKPEVVVTITNPAPSDANHLAAASNSIARNGVPIVAGLPPNSSFTDRKVGGGEVEYVVTAVTTNGGTATSF